MNKTILTMLVSAVYTSNWWYIACFENISKANIILANLSTIGMAAWITLETIDVLAKQK